MTIIKYMIYDSLLYIKRNKKSTSASVLIIALSLFLFSNFLILQTFINKSSEYLENQLKLTIILDNNANLDQISSFLKSSNDIESFEFVDNHSFFSSIKDNLSTEQSTLEHFNEDDFPNSFFVVLNSNNNVELLKKELITFEGITDIYYPKQFAEKLLNFIEKITLSFLILLFILFVASYLTITNTIYLSIQQRKKEIRIKSLLGTSDSFIKLQFIFEGIFIGFVSSLVSCFLFLVTYFSLFHSFINSLVGFIPSIQFIITMILICMLFFGLIIGVFGSFNATRKILK